MEELSEIGCLIDMERPSTMDVLNDLGLRNSAGEITLQELGNPDCGILTPVDAETAEQIGAPVGTVAVITWSIHDLLGDDDRNTEVARAVDENEKEKVLGRVMSTAIDRLVEYAKSHPFEDGHPAAHVIALHTGR